MGTHSCGQGFPVRTSDGDGAVLEAGAALFMGAGKSSTVCPGEDEQGVELAVLAASRVTLP